MLIVADDSIVPQSCRVGQQGTGRMRRPPKFDLDDFLPYRLAVAAERLSAEFSRSYTQTFGLSNPEWRVLVHLTQTGEISVRDIEKRVGLENGT